MADDDMISRREALQLVAECDAKAKDIVDKYEQEVEHKYAEQVEQLRQRLADERKLRLREKDRLVSVEGGFRFLVVPKPRELNQLSASARDAPPADADTEKQKERTSFDFPNHAITIHDDDDQHTRFDAFDYLLPPTLGSTDHIWDECEFFVDGVFNQPPRRLLMLAHGRTGSGKTHVMASAEHGMIARTLMRMFKHKEDDATLGHAVTIEATSVDLYCDKAYDHNNTKLAFTRDTADSGGWDVRYAKESPEPGTGELVERITLPTIDDANAFLASVRSQRESRTKATKVNAHSSRSHLIVAFFVTRDSGADGGRSEGSIHLADLAGNESAQDAEITKGERLHLVRALGTLPEVLSRIRARSREARYNQKQATRGQAPEQGLAKTDVADSAWAQSDLLKALHLPLSTDSPRVLVLLTLHEADFTLENKRTLHDGYNWAGRVLPKPQGRSNEQARKMTKAAHLKRVSDFHNPRAEARSPGFGRQGTRSPRSTPSPSPMRFGSK